MLLSLLQDVPVEPVAATVEAMPTDVPGVVLISGLVITLVSLLRTWKPTLLTPVTLTWAVTGFVTLALWLANQFLPEAGLGAVSANALAAGILAQVGYDYAVQPAIKGAKTLVSKV